jgi:hypothetical protein
MIEIYITLINSVGTTILNDAIPHQRPDEITDGKLHPYPVVVTPLDPEPAAQQKAGLIKK